MDSCLWLWYKLLPISTTSICKRSYFQVQHLRCHRPSLVTILRFCPLDYGSLILQLNFSKMNLSQSTLNYVTLHLLPWLQSVGLRHLFLYIRIPPTRLISRLVINNYLLWISYFLKWHLIMTIFIEWLIWWFCYVF